MIRQFFNDQIPILNFGKGASMDLKRNDAVMWDGCILLRVIHRFYTIEPKLDMPVLRSDSIVVPIAWLENRCPRFLADLNQISISPAFII